MQPVLERGSIDKPLTFDVGLIQLSFIPVCSPNTCNISGTNLVNITVCSINPRNYFLRGFGDHNFEIKAAVRGYHTYIEQCGLPC